VRDLLELGHDVEVWTTTGRDISPVAHWGVEWTAGYPEGLRDENGVRVRRFPMRKVRREWLGLGAKWLQRKMEGEEDTVFWDFCDDAPEIFRPEHKQGRVSSEERSPKGPSVELLTGWHHPEVVEDGVRRWTGARASLRTWPSGVGGVLTVSGYSPLSRSIESIFQYEGECWPEATPVAGDFQIAIELPSGQDIEDAQHGIQLAVDAALSPIRDHRRLGVLVREVTWKPEGSDHAVSADLWRDWRALGRAVPEEYRAALLAAASKRSRLASRLFDFLRGPRSPKLARALRNPPVGFDYVVAANLPWSIISMVAKNCPLPMLAMPLWHIEDDYYYWPHYLDALKKAKLVLANTPYSAEKFFKPLGIKAAFVGPGVPEQKAEGGRQKAEEAAAWKTRVGVAADEAVVLSVCRKSPEKRYDLVAEAVGLLRAEGRAVRFVLIGPDIDRRPLPDHVVHLGRVDDAELDAAYRACNVFALMSESESFGMVLAEAWMRGRPVIANRLCGPAASIVDEGVDGLLASDARELAQAIASLLDDSARADAMGAAGEAKARREFTQRAATMRLLAALAESGRQSPRHS